MADLLLEIGSEELPAGVIDGAARDLSLAVQKALDEARLTHGAATGLGTPRRLAVIVKDVADAQPNLDKEVLGPPVKAAFDAAGKPTQAALGFARVNGLEVDKLERVRTPKGEYLGAHVHEVGKPASELLPALLRGAVAGLKFPKSMRWGALDETYARPILWILALHGERALDFTYAGVRSGHHSRGHRFMAPEQFQVKSAATYVAALRERKVEPDRAVRKQLVEAALQQAIAPLGAVSIAAQKGLLDQVVNLVEWPLGVLGSFEAKYLALPKEVLLSELTVHQRYFAVLDGKTEQPSPHFVAVAGTVVRKPEVAAHGFERVLRARLSDAQFFWDEDRKQTLEARVPSLGTIVFQQKLGTVLEKSERVAKLADFLAQELRLSAPERQAIQQAARLAKADLVSGMVGEFPELQGIMGGYYARAEGLASPVAAAIRDQYLPKFVGDALPGGVEGCVLGLSERLDTLAGMFGIGKPPTGSADPFALRRACLAIIALACQKHLRFSLEGCLNHALTLLAGKLTEPPEATLVKLLEFFRARLKAAWGEELGPDVVEAVLVSGFDDLWAARKRLEGLGAVVRRGDFQNLATAFKRAVSLLEKVPADRLAGDLDPEKLIEEPERQLWKAQLDVRRRVDARLAKSDYGGALEDMATLKPAIDLFFDKVLVMAEDSAVRDNRLRLLFALRSLFGEVCDLSQLQGPEKGDT